MLCPFCGHRSDRVVDSRENKAGDTVRRRRECRSCYRRFTSHERIEEAPLLVVKKGGRREQFDRSKLLVGLLKACNKRPVSSQRLDQIVDDVERNLLCRPDREMNAREIGEYLLSELRQIDKVAYVRFASVYLEFKDVRSFTKALGKIFELGK